MPVTSPSGTGSMCASAPPWRVFEAKIFVEEVVSRYSAIEVTGTPQRTLSILENGFQHLPISFAS